MLSDFGAGPIGTTVAGMIMIASMMCVMKLTRAGLMRLDAWQERTAAAAVARETWATFEPADDLELWLLQRDGSTLGEFLEKIEHDREAIAQREAADKARTQSGHVDVFGYKVLRPSLHGVMAAAGHPVHGTARRWVTGEMEVYCLACNSWVAAGAALEHVHPMEEPAVARCGAFDWTNPPDVVAELKKATGT